MTLENGRAIKLNVFISYSRDDLEFADQLEASLKLYGFATMLDRYGIAAGEDWKRRLGMLIRDADTVAFVLSPASASSELCKWEISEAGRLGKRIIPIICRDLEGVTAPQALAELNYIFFYSEPKFPGSGFGRGLTALISALETDLDWLREHTRLLQRASEWETGGRPENRLLSGGDIATAKAWAERRPKDAPAPTVLHLDFIRVSEERETKRRDEDRRKLAEREKLVREAEDAVQEKAAAQNREAEGSLRLLRRTQAGFMIASVLVAVAVGLAVLAERLREQAVLESTRAAQEVEIVQLFSGQFRAVGGDPRSKAEREGGFFRRVSIAAERGNVAAMRILGFLYGDGQGVDLDGDKALEWLQKAAEAGDAKSMIAIGLKYYRNEDDQGFTKAREWFERGATLGDGAALTLLGVLYAEGQGVRKDFGKAYRYFEAAAAAGNPNGMEALGMLYADGNGVPQDSKKAREWLEKGAATGDEGVMLELGQRYFAGRGVPKDELKAVEWMKKAAAAGSLKAYAALAAAYELGSSGLPKDHAKARQWVEKAAEAGDPDSMVMMGALYWRDEPPNTLKAREWLEKAAAAGKPDAMENAMETLATIYMVAPADYSKAYAWSEKAAAEGSSGAMLQLGQLYLDGFGVAKDLAKAREWIEKAISAGNTEGAKVLEELKIRERRSIVESAK